MTVRLAKPYETGSIFVSEAFDYLVQRKDSQRLERAADVYPSDELRRHSRNLYITSGGCPSV